MRRLSLFRQFSKKHFLIYIENIDIFFGLWDPDILDCFRNIFPQDVITGGGGPEIHHDPAWVSHCTAA